jgi:hypothetical protein
MQLARVTHEAAALPHLARIQEQRKRLAERRLQNEAGPVVGNYEMNIDGYVQRPV